MRTFYLAFRVFVLVLSIMLAAFGHAQGTQTVGMHAVPTPGTVTIDGKLDDWDLSGQRLMCYDLSSLRDRFSVTTALMYDAQYYYVALRWKDPTPMVNYYDPKTEGGWAWRADCVQLRIKTDRIAHVDAWYYTKTRQPAMFIQYGAMGVTPPDPDTAVVEDAMAAGAKQAFSKDADGKGYVQEIAIPWQLLTRDGHALTAGDSMATGFEILWGRENGRDWYVHRYADNVSEQARSGAIFFWMGPNAWGKVTLSPTGQLSLPPQRLQGETIDSPQGPIVIPFTVPKAGYVTLAIDDASGRRVRTLLAEAYYPAGSHEVRWDGADDDGNLVPAGAYQWKGLTRDSLHAKYVLSYYTAGDPPWDTAEPTSAWISDHNNPSSIAADRTQVYINCPGVESGWAPVAVGLDGKKRWGSKDAGIQVAVDNGVVYSVCDLGAPASTPPGQTAKIDVVVTRINAQDGRYAPFNNPALPSGGVKATVYSYQASANNIYDLNSDILNLQGAAARAGLLCLAFRRDNVIRVVDSTTGNFIRDISVPAPAGLAFIGDDSLLAVSGTQVVRVDVNTGTCTPVITTGLEAPQQLCLGTKGQIFVSDWGKSQQIKVFSAEGRLLRGIGKAGGRALMGKYNAHGFYRPRGIAIDAKGRLWVAEDTDSPRRISVWTLRGKLLQQFFGPGFYSGGGLLDPEDNTVAYYHNMEFKLNYATGDWKLTRIVSGFFGPDAFRMNVGTGIPNRLVRYRGQTYLVGSHLGVIGWWAIARKRPDGIFQPLAAVGSISASTGNPYFMRLPTPLQGKDRSLRYAWSDRNGDGVVQDDEVTYAPSKPGKELERIGIYWGNDVQDDLTLVAGAGNDYLGFGGMGVWKFPVKGWTECGAPIYDVAHPEILVDAVPSPGLTSLIAMKDTSVIVNAQPVFCYGPDGTVRWTFPNPELGPYDSGPLRPGKLIGPQGILGRVDMGGEIGEVVMFNGYNGSRFMMTADGLFIGHVFNDCRNGPEALPAKATRGFIMDDTSCGGESFNGSFVRTRDGKVYTLTGQTDARIAEVTGLESIIRINGALTVSTAQRDAAAEFLASQAQEARQAKRELIIAGAAAPKIDGELSDWDVDQGVSWRASETRGATVIARHDGTHLYLAYQVDDTTPMVNTGKNVNLLFKTGDCVDMWLGTDPSADPQRSGPVKGDIRLLFSVMDGNPIAVIYEAVVPGTTNPIPFSSPARTVHIDRVRVLNEATVVVTRGLTGYVVEASVPLSAIGLAAQTAVLRGDFGVIYSDATGTKNELRSYWSNKVTGIVMDIPDESLFAPTRWGTVIMK